MKYQVMPDLTPIEYEALKADIAKRGVMIPVELDENGDVLDGHHRIKIWHELRAEGIDLADYPRLIRVGMTEEEKRNHARSLNVLRRHLSKEQRDEVARQMRADGATIQKIADAIGVGIGTVHRALDGSTFPTGKVEGADGKYRPASYERKPAPAPTMFEATIPTWQPPDRPSTAIFASSAREEKRALTLAGDVPTNGAGIVTIKDAGDMAKETRRQERKQRPTIPAQPAALPATVTIHNADARHLAGLEIAPVHLVITSPPYNVGIDYATHSDDMTPEEYADLLLGTFEQCHQVMTDGARIAVIVPFGVGRCPWEPIPPTVYRLLSAAGFTLRGQIIWDKNTTGNRTSWGSFRNPSDPALRDTTEAIIVAHKGSGKLAIPDAVKAIDGKGAHTAALADSDYFMELAQDHWIVAPESAQRIGHPAPFPVELAKRLIDFYAYPGAHVLDPFGGSGTTAIAAMRADCSATLIEISAEYCRLAEERIAHE